MSLPTRALYRGEEYDVLNFMLDAEPFPSWVLRDAGNDTTVRSDDSDLANRVVGLCPVCGQFSIVVAPEGPSGRPEWVCEDPECAGPSWPPI